MAETASRLKDPSALPSSTLMADISNASKSLSALRERVLELAHNLAVPYEGEPESIEDLKRLLDKTLSVEERTAEGVGETLDLPASPAASVVLDLPSEVEEFLESVIEEVSKAKEAQRGFPPSRATEKSAPVSVPPKKQEIPIPEVPRPEPKEPTVQRETPPVLETIDKPATLVPTPPKRQVHIPEVPRPEPPKAPTVQRATPSTSETIIPEARSPQKRVEDKREEQTKYAKKEQFFQDSVELMEKTVGATHPEVADLLGNMALLYYRQGKYADAEVVYQRALKIREESLGTEHPKVATTLNNLAILYRDQGDFAKAQEFWERSLAIVEKVFGAEHPKTALRVANLADLFYTQGKYEQAETFYQRLVAVLEKSEKEERPRVASSLKNYLELLRKSQRKEEALQVEAHIKRFYS
ncbi:MAG: tetratricopeptide repeat protein [Acidobacteria bacterium]|nr:tetratricopeptide repeat protein [Acidobacteriota bacterium]